MMKRILCILTAFVFIFASSSCNNNQSEPEAERIDEDSLTENFCYEWEVYSFPACPLRAVYSEEEYVMGHFYADETEYCRTLITDRAEDFFPLIQAAQEYAESLGLEECSIGISYIERYLLHFLSPDEWLFTPCDTESEFYKQFFSFSMDHGELPFSIVRMIKDDGEWLVIFDLPSTLAYRAREEEEQYFVPYILLTTHLVYGDADKAAAALKTSDSTLFERLEPTTQTEKDFWLLTDCHYSTGLTPPDDKNTVWKVHAGGDVYYDLET